MSCFQLMLEMSQNKWDTRIKSELSGRHQQQKQPRKCLLIMKERTTVVEAGLPLWWAFITQKGHFKLDGVMNEGVKRKCLRQRREWALSFKCVESGNSICAYP